MKTVIITGATSGIGEECVRKFLTKSFTVIATGRNKEKLQELHDLGAYSYELDVTNQKDIKNFVTEIINKHEKIDILINNAGFGQFGVVEEIDIETAKKQFDTNVFGLAGVTKEILPHMRKNHSGRIVNISSIAGITSMPGIGWYSASKHAVEALSDTLRWELKPFGIKVIKIQPGPLKTGFANVANTKVVKLENSEYGKLVEIVTTEFTKSTKNGNAKGCAETIFKAATKKNPKNRYIYTKKWYLIVFLIRTLPAKFIDFIITKLLKYYLNLQSKFNNDL